MRSGREGFVLIVTTIALTILLGLAAIIVDAGRMYVIKSELQAFTDAASLSAVMQLDGTPAGQEKARKAARDLAEGDHAMKWDMGSRPIGDIHLYFDQPTQVRVVVSEPAPVIFIKALGVLDAGSPMVSASSIAAAGPVRLLQ
jgi:Putative Flp pilus-assembly TadE/G-like